ncbi:hypothetical protein BN000_01470 [Mycobacterium europaeum]|uniref:Uncharacterized protein n=1 Tax=Mycobacterium europaeum TaxID=761804 RepID=A0A0U1D3A0_9MYCO|nr:hypothetical protein [Mycobacterium europaeum]CQD07362.1 hypothetical protein BN000_01470 [Mycobacterium europaeum]
MRGCGGFAFLILVVFTIAKNAVWIGLAIAIVAALALAWKCTDWLDRLLERREARRASARFRRAEIARRADEQNQLYLAGDDRGIYGDYRPEVYPTG